MVRRTSTPAATSRQRSATGSVSKRSTVAPSRSPSAATRKTSTTVAAASPAATRRSTSTTTRKASTTSAASKSRGRSGAATPAKERGSSVKKKGHKDLLDAVEELDAAKDFNHEDQKEKDDHYRLVGFDEASPLVQMNPFIRTGYRFQYNTRMCLWSMLQIHNESGNVWTHGIGLILFFILSGLVYKYVLESHITHIVVFTLFMFGCAMCMACSCMYHLFNCHHDEKLASTMFLFDLLGIATLIAASFVPYIYFSFACLPQWRIIYLVMIGVLGSGGIAAPFVDLDERFAIYRTLLYVAITSSGIFPTCHIIFGFPMNGPILAPMNGLALMFLLYGTGLIFYLAKIPERWYPGHFDYWLNSHQIWHLFVLAAALCHFFACVSLYRRYHIMDSGGSLC